MKCLLCGKELPENAKFCDSCGARVPLVNENSGVNSINDNAANIIDNGLSNIASNGESEIQNEFGGLDKANDNQLNNNTNSDIINTNSFVGPSVEAITSNNINSQNMMNSNNPMNTNETPSSKKKKSKALIIIIIIIFIVAILAALAWLFFNKKTKAKTVFVDGFKNVSEKLFLTTDNYKSMNSSLKFNFDVDDSSSEGIINTLNNLSLDFSLNYDDKNQTLDSFIKANYEGNQALDIDLYGSNNSLYLYLDGLYDKYIKLPITEEEYTKMFKQDMSNNKALKSGLDKAFESALKDEYLSKQSETIKINGVDTKVNVNKLSFTDKTFEQFALDFTKALREDEEFLKAAAAMFDSDVEAIKSSLSIDSSTDFDEDTIIEFIIYTKGASNSFVGVAMNVIEEDEKVSLSVLKIDENNYELSMTQGSTTIGGKLNIVKSGETQKATFTMTVGSNTIGFTMDTTYSKEAKIDTKDVSNAVSFEEFSQNGAIDVQNNMMQNETLVKLIQDIMSETQGISSSNPYGEEDYQLDDDGYTNDYAITENSEFLY